MHTALLRNDGNANVIPWATNGHFKPNVPSLDACALGWSHRSVRGAGVRPVLDQKVRDVSELPAGVSEGGFVDDIYLIGPVIGAGAMGTVVEARDVRLDRKVAIKFLKPDALGHAAAVARFLVEARSAAQLVSDHAVRIYGVGTLEVGAPYIVMEYLEGCDLADWLRRKGAMPVDLAVDFILQACDAIAEAHERRIIHRDVKPANLFALARGNGAPRIKVLDFGISKNEALVSETLPPGASPVAIVKTEDKATMGSLFYMSPEQMESSRDVDLRTDVWALGVTLCELVTGYLPFKAKSMVELYAVIISGARPDLSDSLARVPPELAAIILKCLECKRDNRYGHVGELASELSGFASRQTARHLRRRATYPFLTAVPATGLGLLVLTMALWLSSLHARKSSSGPIATVIAPSPVVSTSQPTSEVAKRTAEDHRDLQDGQRKAVALPVAFAAKRAAKANPLPTVTTPAPLAASTGSAEPPPVTSVPGLPPPSPPPIPAEYPDEHSAKSLENMLRNQH